MGRDLQVEVVLESGEVVVAQVPRDQIDHTSLGLGDQVHIVSRQARTFVPDYSI
jgi:sulfate transport system ATP-binding protein